MINSQLGQTINEIQQLSSNERIELLKATCEQLLAESQTRSEVIELIMQLLQETQLQKPLSLSHLGQDFWHPKTVHQHIAEQQVTLAHNLDEMAMNLWPQEQTADNFIDFVYQQRQLTEGKFNG